MIRKLLPFVFVLTACGTASQQQAEVVDRATFSYVLMDSIPSTRDSIDNSIYFGGVGKPFSGTVRSYDREDGGYREYVVQFGHAIRMNCYYGSGALETAAEMYNGRLHGSYSKFFENGQKYIQHEYVSGNIVGLYQRWDERGNLLDEKNFSTAAANLPLVMLNPAPEGC